MKPTQKKMDFFIKAIDVVPGAKSEICKFSINFGENEEEKELKMKLNLKFDCNKMIKDVECILLGEK